MAILNTQVETVGQSGQVPKFIYIDTNNSVSEVVTSGFLNSLVQQGIPINETDMALVSTRDTPESRSAETRLFNVSFSGGNWSLIQNSGDAWLVGGNELDVSLTPVIFGALTNQAISFRANNQQYMAFDTVTNSLTIDAATVKLSNITSTTTPDILYYDSGTKSVFFSPAGSAGSGWLLDATNGGGGLAFGTNTADGWDIRVNGSNIAVVDNTGSTFYSSGVQFDGRFNVDSDQDIFITTTTGAVGINSITDIDIFTQSGNMNLDCNSGTFNLQTHSGGINLNSENGDINLFAGIGGSTGRINIQSDHEDIDLTTGGAGNVFINSGTTGQANINGGGGAANISFSTSGIGMGVSAGSGMSVDAVTGNFSFGASTGSFLIGALSNSVQMLAGTTFTLGAGTGINLTTSTGDLKLIATAGVVNVVTQTHASVAGSPTIHPPAGFSYVIMEDATGNIYRMT